MSKDSREKDKSEKDRSQKEEKSNNKTSSNETIQTHVHEFLASTKLAEEEEDRHNHRFAGITSEVIPKGDNHVHVIFTNTDFLDHHHEVGIETGPAIRVGNGKHVHFVKGTTTFDDGHVHEIEFATLIQKPLV